MALNFLMQAIDLISKAQDEIAEVLQKIDQKLDIAYFAKLKAGQSLLRTAGATTDTDTRKSLLIAALSQLEEAEALFKQLSLATRVTETTFNTFTRNTAFILTLFTVESVEAVLAKKCLQKMLYLRGYSVAHAARSCAANELGIFLGVDDSQQFVYDQITEGFFEDAYGSSYATAVIKSSRGSDGLELMRQWVNSSSNEIFRTGAEVRLQRIQDLHLLDPERTRFAAAFTVAEAAIKVIGQDNQ